MRPKVHPVRRGAAFAVLVVVVSVLNLAVIAALGGADADANISGLRVETARAFYASESGVSVVVRAVLDGEELPPAGTLLSVGDGVVEFLESPPGGVGDLELEGRAGRASRRIRLSLE